MKTINLIALLTLITCSVGFSQTKLPVKFRVDKQAMSTPMSSLEDMFFINPYYAKPVNINFDGSLLSMYFDNGSSFVKKNVTEVDRDMEFEKDNLTLETILYTDNQNASDTISFVVDHSVGYVQIILPTKNSKGENIGYTSYKKFIGEDDLALK